VSKFKVLEIKKTPQTKVGFSEGFTVLQFEMYTYYNLVYVSARDKSDVINYRVVKVNNRPVEG